MKARHGLKNSSNSFDVAMHSFNGAETCELVGSYLLCKLPGNIREQVGLYRDNDLGIFQETPQKNRIKIHICRVFTENGLKLTLEATRKIIDFLSVTLNLSKGILSHTQSLTTPCPMYVMTVTIRHPSSGISH